MARYRRRVSGKFAASAVAAGLILAIAQGHGGAGYGSVAVALGGSQDHACGDRGGGELPGHPAAVAGHHRRLARRVRRSHRRWHAAALRQTKSVCVPLSTGYMVRREPLR